MEMEEEIELAIYGGPINVFYEKKQILYDLSLKIEKNKITSIIGQSGCGKSTLLKSFNRMIEEENGKVTGTLHLFEENILKMEKDKLRKSIGMVFQQPIVFPFSIEKNMTYGLNYHFSLTKKERQEKVCHYLSLSGLYDEVKGDLSMLAAKLSGGQKQRLAISRAISVEPEVLLLDEPCSALDMKNTLLIEELLCQLKSQYTIVIVTHNLAQAKRISDQVIFMDEGKIIETSEKEKFFADPSEPLSREYIQYMEKS
jgi:phosphate transport system ATP-binding protein